MRAIDGPIGPRPRSRGSSDRHEPPAKRRRAAGAATAVTERRCRRQHAAVAWPALSCPRHRVQRRSSQLPRRPSQRAAVSTHATLVGMTAGHPHLRAGSGGCGDQPRASACSCYMGHELRARREHGSKAGAAWRTGNRRRTSCCRRPATHRGLEPPTTRAMPGVPSWEEPGAWVELNKRLTGTCDSTRRPDQTRPDVCTGHLMANQQRWARERALVNAGKLAEWAAKGGQICRAARPATRGRRRRSGARAVSAPGATASDMLSRSASVQAACAQKHGERLRRPHPART